MGANMKTNTKLTSIALSLALAFAPLNGRADWIGDFYTSAGAGMNVTAAQAISSQSVVGVSGGGLEWRIPNKNFQVVSITPPRLSSGCGGIDMYLGAYSFPNKDAFVQALRNFGQAAIGYFFQLALKTMAPEIAATLEVINDLAQRMNALGMNSCAAAKQFVDSVAGEWMEKNARDASGYARSIGSAVDEFDSLLGQRSGGYAKTMEDKYKQNYNKSQSALTKDDVATKLPVEVNVVHYVLSRSRAVDLTDDEIGMIMALIGPSLIIRRGQADDGSASPINAGKIKLLDYKQVLGGEVDSGGSPVPFTVYTCNSEPQCLDPQPVQVTYLSFQTRINNVITKIRTNVSSRTSALSLTAAETNVLKLASVPLYRAAAMAETTGVAQTTALVLLPDLADYAALDASMRFVNYFLNILDKALAATVQDLDKTFHPDVQNLRTRITDIKADMHQQAIQLYKLKGDPFQKLDQLERAERYMYANLNVMLGANARFGKNQ